MHYSFTLHMFLIHFSFLKNNTVHLQLITKTICRAEVHELQLKEKGGRKVKNLDEDGEVAGMKLGKLR